MRLDGLSKIRANAQRHVTESTRHQISTCRGPRCLAKPTQIGVLEVEGIIRCFSQAIRKYSQLDMSVMYDHETRAQGTHDVTTPTTPTNTRQGLALCHRVTLESVAHWWVPARTPTVHWCPDREGCGRRTTASTTRRPTNDNTTKTGLSQTCDTTTRC